MDSLKNKIEPGSIVLMGVPFDEYSTFMRGAALGPSHIRAAFLSGSTNQCTESGTDLTAEPRLKDVGDIELSNDAQGYTKIESIAAAVLGQNAYLLSLGGDHSITYPLLKAYAQKYDRLSLLHIDAHPDLYDEFEGNRFSHACPFARIMGQRLASRLVQVGIRTATPHQRAQAKRFGVETIEMQNWRADMVLEFQGPVYLSVDLDALDPAFAPGVSHPEPGGLSTRDIVRIIQGVKAPIVGADIVELNPKRDPLGITAMVAAKLLKEIAVKMIDSAWSLLR
jgi:agmatinase